MIVNFEILRFAAERSGTLRKLFPEHLAIRGIFVLILRRALPLFHRLRARALLITLIRLAQINAAGYSNVIQTLIIFVTTV